MSGMEMGPVMRRYWLADGEALGRLAATVDAPDWGESPVPLTVFSLDDAAMAAFGDLDGGMVEIVDARGGIGAALAARLDGERALYVQIASDAVEDFPPAMALLAERLDAAGPAVFAGRVMRSGPALSSLADDLPPEALWINTGKLRDSIGLPPDIEALRELLGRLAEDSSIERSELLLGAVFAAGGDADEAAMWRARAAAAEAESDRLRSERRIRLGREAALKARHERDLARQAGRFREEIGRLHVAAGLTGRLRARLRRWNPFRGGK